MKKAINLADISLEGVLLVKKRNIWIFPGGKPELGESDFDCLYRELKEELSVSKEGVSIYNYYGSFIDKTPFSHKDLEAKIYFGHLGGPLKPDNEIVGFARVRKDNLNKYPVSLITRKIINSLLCREYLK